MSEHTKGQLYAGEDYLFSETGRTVAEGMTPGDAAEVAKRWNAHEALVDALQALLRDCDNTKGIIHPKGHPGYLQARAALALARGE